MEKALLPAVGELDGSEEALKFTVRVLLLDVEPGEDVELGIEALAPTPAAAAATSGRGTDGSRDSSSSFATFCSGVRASTTSKDSTDPAFVPVKQKMRGKEEEEEEDERATRERERESDHFFTDGTPNQSTRRSTDIVHILLQGYLDPCTL